MTDTPNPSSESCEEFQARLAQLFESQTDQEKEEHLKTCERCAELVRDLNYIAQQAKLLLPIHDPSPELWGKIQKEIVNSGTSR
jgi:hypothetical protein